MEEKEIIELWNGVLYLKQQSSAERDKEDTSVDVKCFELLVLMLKNCTVYNFGDRESQDWKLIGGHPYVVRDNQLFFARELGILNPKLKTQRGIMNDAIRKIDNLRAQIYRCFDTKEPIIGYEKDGYLYCLNRFNSKYFIELRNAVEVNDSLDCFSPIISGGKLPPLTFPNLVVIALDCLRQEDRPWISFSLETPDVDRREMFIVSLEMWDSRSGDWTLYDDVAPINISVLTYEKKDEGFKIKVFSREIDKKIQALLDALEKVANKDLEIKIEKQMLEPVGKTAKEIRQFLSDKANMDGSITSKVARMLNDRTQYIGYEEIKKINELITLKGWKHEEISQWDSTFINPFVKIAYKENLSEEEKIQYESYSLSKLGEIMEMDRIHPQGYEKCIAIPYMISYHPKFPFADKEQVKIRIEKDTLVIEKK